MTLSLSVVSPMTIRRLNRDFRKKDRVTDVLSFPQMPVRVKGLRPCAGDVVICLARARSQAKEASHPLEKEIATLVVHGVLHLFGYDHEKSAKEARRMFRLQDRIVDTITPHLLYKVQPPRRR